MLIMGSNNWERDMPKEVLVTQALKFADEVKVQGVAELQGAWIAPEDKKLWCYWETDKLEELQAAFDDMNARSGLKSTLHKIEDMLVK